MYVAWEDLTVVIPNFGEGATKRLLNGVNGCGEPNRILAIMGPSGSGKSTLLDALAGPFSLSQTHTPIHVKISSLFLLCISFIVKWFSSII